MATKKSNDHGLEQAMTLLMHNQTAFLSSHRDAAAMIDLEEHLETKLVEWRVSNSTARCKDI